MIRRIWSILACSVLLQVLAVSPAHAWWEYIEALSGPKLHGPHIEWRLLCFMEPGDAETLGRYLPLEETVQPTLGQQAQSLLKQTTTTMFPGGLVGPCIKKQGVGDRRRFSIDLGARFLWDKSFAPAGGETVKFLSLEPVVTWYMFRKPTHDVLDLSGGGGFYRFSSKAFSPFKGGFVEFPRFDVHVPTVVRRLSKWTFFIPSGRLGFLWFLEGFDANVFANTSKGLTSKPMEGTERGMYFGFFFDMDALCRPNDLTPHKFLRVICNEDPSYKTRVVRR